MTIRFNAKGKGSAEILLYGDIGASFWGDGITAKAFADQLKELGKVDQLDVRINSYGGDVFDGLAIHRQLIDSGAEITTHIDGIAASIASVIAMAGSKIIISESGYMMIHDAWTVAIGNADELREVATRVDATSADMAQLYAKRSGSTEDKIRDWMKAETWFNGKEAVLVGLADEVAENVAVAARAAPDWIKLAMAKFSHMPSIEPPTAPAIVAVNDPAGDTIRARIAERKHLLKAGQARLSTSGRG